ncbi:MAG: response regulator [Lachnospiraceae bacterium]|nr:response regulator [Lachnospiraceae bacterium]
MDTYHALLIVQFVTIAAIFAASALIFTNWRNKTHGALFFYCMSSLINNVGYTAVMLAQTQSEALISQKLSYLGRAFIPFALLLFVLNYCNRMTKRTKVIMHLLLLLHVFIYISVLTAGQNHLYYTEIGYTRSGFFPHLVYRYGPVHILYNIVILVYVIVGIAFLLKKLSKEKKMRKRRGTIFVICSILAITVFFILEITGIGEAYDMTMLGYAVSALFLLIALLRYDLLDTRRLAEDFVLDRLSEAIIAVDKNGETGFFNDPAQRLFPGLLDKSDETIAKIDALAENGAVYASGDRKYVPEKNLLMNNGREVGTVYVFNDDTEHLRYLVELEEQKAIAVSANKAKSTFLANMSHDIRTPLNAVLGMDEMILRESREKDTLSYAADIQSAGETLLSLINDILDISKVEEGKLEIIPVQYELASLIHDLTNMIRDRAVKKGLDFKLKVNEEIPHLLFGDEIRIRQCVMNLLTNAVKYTNTGSVSMEVDFEETPGEGEDKRISLSFKVKDTGIGIKEEDMEALFTPFQRIEEKRNRHIEGTGLGMSIVQELLSLMGTKLSVSSEYGKGSSFSFSVEQGVVSEEPIGDITGSLEGGRKIASYQESFTAPDARIMVVDDTEVNLTVIKNLLKKTLLQVDTAQSGKEALSLAAVHSYDAIFLDHMMPDMDGIETLHEMKKRPEVENTVFIALTANALSGARERYIGEGFFDFLSKPVDPERLEKLLMRILPKEKQLPAQDPEKAEERPKDTILLIDDDDTIHALLKEQLKDKYELLFAFDGKEGIRKAEENDVSLILLDVKLGSESGFDVLSSLKSKPQTKDIPVILVTGEGDAESEEKGFYSGAEDYVRKPFAPETLRERIKRTIKSHHLQGDLRQEADTQSDRANRLTREMMMALSKAVDMKDHYTNGHSRRVAAYSAEIARRMGKSREEQEELYEIGLMHDIGKIGIHEDIITKDSKLTDDEFAEIKEHTIKGYEILRNISDMPSLAEGARSHHERFGGNGYPDGLKGEEIPEKARIVCVADCYDAMTSTRTYSKPKTQEQVRAEIERCIGTIFDPVPAKAMLLMIDEDKDFLMNENSDGSDIWQGFKDLWDFEKKDGEGAKDHNIFQRLKVIPVLDVDKGVQNCGSEESLISVARVFADTALAKADEIGQYYVSEDIENYTVKVHALKSAARIIGAERLSDLSMKLEEAGKEGNIDFIKENTSSLLDQYRDLYERLSGALDEKEKGPLASKEMVEEAKERLLSACDTMDFGEAESVLKELSDLTLDEKEREFFDRIKEHLLMLDWDSIEEMLNAS